MAADKKIKDQKITDEMILIMIRLLIKEKEQVVPDSIPSRFLSFYNEHISSEEAKAEIEKLRKQNLVEVTQNRVSITPTGFRKALECNYRYYFSAGIQKAGESQAEKQYQMEKSLLGKDTQSDSVTDKPQVDYIVSQLQSCPGKVLDLGCGRGDITAMIARESGQEVTGADKSAEMLALAETRHSEMSWITCDLENLNLKGQSFHHILLIDSIYFVKDLITMFTTLKSGLHPGGAIIFTYSDYVQSKSDMGKIQPENTRAGKALANLGYSYKSVDFTNNEYTALKHKFEVIQNLKNEYQRENNEYLYYDKIVETRSLFERHRQGCGRRYLYQVSF